MAKGYEEYFDEDECCLECGEPNFEASKIPGVCYDCYIDLHTGVDEREIADELVEYLFLKHSRN